MTPGLLPGVVTGGAARSASRLDPIAKVGVHRVAELSAVSGRLGGVVGEQSDEFEVGMVDDGMP